MNSKNKPPLQEIQSLKEEEIQALSKSTLEYLLSQKTVQSDSQLSRKLQDSLNQKEQSSLEREDLHTTVLAIKNRFKELKHPRIILVYVSFFVFCLSFFAPFISLSHLPESTQTPFEQIMQSLNSVLPLKELYYNQISFLLSQVALSGQYSNPFVGIIFSITIIALCLSPIVLLVLAVFNLLKLKAYLQRYYILINLLCFVYIHLIIMLGIYFGSVEFGSIMMFAGTIGLFFMQTHPIASEENQTEAPYFEIWQKGNEHYLLCFFFHPIGQSYLLPKDFFHHPYKTYWIKPVENAMDPGQNPLLTSKEAILERGEIKIISDPPDLTIELRGLLIRRTCKIEKA